MRLAALHFSDDGTVLIARLEGEVDLSNARDIALPIRRRVSNDTFGVVLDLTDVRYLDSAGIQLIYHLREVLGARGQRLLLVTPTASPVNDALRLAGVSDQVVRAETLPGALAALSGEALGVTEADA